MVGTPVIVTIVSVCVGFVIFMLAASGARGKWDRRLVIGLFVAAVVCLTVVPVSVALSAGVSGV
ncbi:hypothetical protein CJ178_18165 [Rhodococcus sp. ACPA4]|jgi:hypothetical protein|uniref:Uncharacterized protein n=2 Tax=Nocardiaceae TaxID=85025 RepID=A0A652YRI2_NOCGL|nr:MULTISPECIES: hypothetical protein [Rhodococcus]NMD63494.1 hypothetical protein [Nocardia globerula]KJF24368.1 hypothetical protein SZ00_01289 [Rhodococcus sp. AD45]MCE4267945.1 hypothetical protein [Rhodococcus globerulus]MDI9914011.1 hypothetical protein [Rhodococcus sp. IEGM 1379]MDV6268760.1 hypothetical protein [Rhodococcus globerulus]